MPEQIPLTALSRELTPAAGSPRPTYREIWNLAVSDELPATMIRGRWYVVRSDLPAIAALLGMTVREPPAGPSTANSAADRLVVA